MEREIRMQASLHGIDIGSAGKEEAKVSVTPEQEEKLKAKILEAQERVRKRING